MAMSMEVEGLDELGTMLETLGSAAPGIAAASLYEGAKVMADGISEQVHKIKTEPFKYAKGGRKRLASPEEKTALMSGEFGIAKFDKNGGEVSTGIGYNAAGYVAVNYNHMSSSARTNYKLFTANGHDVNQTSLLKALGVGAGAQNMKPTGAIANAINSGTSFMTKQPFFRKAVSSASGKASAAIVQKAEEMINNITGEG